MRILLRLAGALLYGRENYHAIGLALFYGNLRRDAQQRVDAFLAMKPAR